VVSGESGSSVRATVTKVTRLSAVAISWVKISDRSFDTE
jgi:hypothetical protein